MGRAEAGIYKSDAVREGMHRWYAHFLARVAGDKSSRQVETRFGETHVLVTGPPDGEPLLCIHGALASSAHALAEVSGLIERYRIYAPDVVGQSVKSAEVRPPVKGPAHAQWVSDVMDGLGLSRVSIFGVSWGGFIALNTAIHAPDRIDKLVLLVPAGLVSGSAWAGFTKVGWPMMRYKSKPSEERLHRALRHMLTTLDPDWVAFLGEAFQGVKLDFRVPPKAKAKDLEHFDRPTLLIAADKDLSFPGRKLIARAERIIPGLAATELLEDCLHSPPFEDGFRAFLCERVTRFLETGS